MPTIDARTGKIITGVAEAFQSLSTALTTQKRTRIMRPEYGAERVNSVDRGISQNNLIDFYAEIAEVMAFEPRLRLNNVRLSEDSAVEAGRAIFDLNCIFYPRGHLNDFSEAVAVNGSVVWSESEGRALPS